MITSRQNPLVKLLRKLHQTKHRHQLGQFLLEGTHLVQEALKVQWPMDILCYTPEWAQRESLLLNAVQQCVPRVECVSVEVLQAMATTVHPDGVLAVGRSRSISSLENGCGSLNLLLDTIQDPGNFGTILRTAVATGVEQVWLSPHCADLENPKVLRASAGAWFQVPCLQILHPQGVSESDAAVRRHLEQCRTQGIQIVATTPRAEQDYWAIDYTKPTLLVVGNEGAGLSETVIAAADYPVKIPLTTQVESLNVAIATAVILYEAKRQRSQQG